MERAGDERFAEALDAIYAAALKPDCWPAALQAIADCFGDIGAILLYGREDGGFGYIESSNVPGLIARFFEVYPGEDLRAARGVERGFFIGRDTITDRHLVTEEEIASHPFYVALAKFGLRYFATTPIGVDFSISAGIAVQRSIAGEPYSDVELDRLARLGRHAENALRIGVRLLEAELTKLALGDALSRLSAAIFLVDEGRRIVFSNAEAERLMGDGVITVAGSLTVQFAPERSELNAQLTAVINGQVPDEPTPVLLHRVDAARPLVAYVLPVRMPREAVADRVLMGARVLILVLDPQADGPPDPATVRDLLGLTLGEARVAALIGSGVPLRQTAKQLGITEATTRSVLKRVFSKVGISRQSELTALLTRLVLR